MTARGCYVEPSTYSRSYSTYIDTITHISTGAYLVWPNILIDRVESAVSHVMKSIQEEDV